MSAFKFGLALALMLPFIGFLCRVAVGRGAFPLWVSRAMTGWRKRQIKEQESMKAQKVFMALMISKGYTPADLAWDGTKFTNPNITTRWNYFLLGWEMRGVM